jgi:hypothetical protein
MHLTAMETVEEQSALVDEHAAGAALGADALPVLAYGSERCLSALSFEIVEVVE